MTNLSDFLKVKKVRFITKDNYLHLTYGRAYDVIGVSHERIKVHNDKGNNSWYDMDCFEPVLDSAENPLQGAELTPEFEAVEPKFKVGHKVYYGSEPDVLTILEFDVDGWARMDSWAGFVDSSRLCHATPENYERLQATFPDIEFERPPKPLSGDDIVKAMLKKGIKNVLCLWGNGDKIIIDRLSYKGGLMSTNCNIVGGLTPIDWYTGEPLTESILND